MTLTNYGRREWMAIVIVAAITAAACAWMGWWWAAGLIAIVALALLSFFRDPSRRIPADLDPGDMLSPADGTVSAVEQVEHHEATGGPAVIVRIFLSVFNVHINRSPCDGAVKSITHRPGKYLDARTAESARVNESNLIVIERDNEETIGVRQVSGAVARRIVCPLSVGDALQRGQQYGMIKFGSTTELILPRPDDVAVNVAVGDKVKGGLTVLARLTQQAEARRAAAHHAEATAPAPAACETNSD